MAKERLIDLIREAVRDISENGYSYERALKWQRLLDNALNDFSDTTKSERMIAKNLFSQFDRKTRQSTLARIHPGIDRFSVERILPTLRPMLSDRILASTDLIRLNREQSVTRTLDRFAGWASSVPPVGTTYKPEEVTHIAKPLRSLPFEERRLMIDQGHKLIGNVNYVLAIQTEAIACIWRHVHQADYAGRPEHEARDGKWFLMKDSWALRDGFVGRGSVEYLEDIDMPSVLPYCRCWAEYYRSIGSLPIDLLTAKGRQAIETAKTA